MNILGVIVLSLLSGVMYRMGGSGNFPRWVRPTGLGCTMLAGLALLGFFHWTMFLCAGAIYGLSTTYFKKKDTDANWLNWLFVGIAFSISVLPLVLHYGNYLGFAVRTVICTGLVVLWSETQGNAVKEEFGRGVIPIATLPLLLI